MKTFNRICIKSHTISDKTGNSMTVERGKEYLTSEEMDGAVLVFGSYWVWFPSHLFSGELVFTK